METDDGRGTGEGAQEESGQTEESQEGEGREKTIYAICEVRYVGSSFDPIRRLQNHKHDKRGKVGAWIKQLEAEGKRPHVVELEKTDIGMAEWREKWWIAKFFRRGELLNQRDTPKKKVSLNVRLTHEAHRIIKEVAAERRITKTAALEYILQYWSAWSKQKTG